MEDNDAQLQLKKRARRRLVGAVAFAGLAAVILPMIMDQEPKQVSQDVEIRIPGQDEKPFAPKFAVTPAAKSTAAPALEAKPAEPAAASKPAEVKDKPVDKAPEKPADKPVPKPAEKTAEKTPDKPPVKPADKPQEKTAKPDADSQRAAAILAGKLPDGAPTAAGNGQHVILIGAFSNQANVRNLQNKLSELGIKAYTEPLDTPQGRKIRVRAGPFANRDTAEKALDKMRRIGVGGVLAPKQ